MPDSNTMLLFVPAALALLIVPGPAVLYIIARSVSQGIGAGMASAMGLSTGAAVHVALASLGISAVIAASTTAFYAMKILGAAYLIYLGVQKLRARSQADVSDNANGTMWRVFRQGIVVNVLNPKLALFFVALLPQFVDPAAGSATLQIAVLGTILVLLGMVTDAAYALGAGSVSGYLRRHPESQRRLDLASAITYITLGIAAAFSSRN